MNEAPWPYVTQKAAAKALGVDVHFLAGLRNGTTLRAVSVQTLKGNWTILYNRKDVETLARRLIRAQS